MDRIKILQLGDLYSFHTIRWHRILNDAGFNVITCGFEPPREEWKDEVTYIESVIIRYPYRYFLIPRKLTDLYNKFSPDLVIAHMIGSYGFVAKKLHAENILAVGWGPDVLNMPFKSPVHRYFFKNVLKGINHFVVDSRNMKEVLIKFGTDADKVSVFPYGPSEKFLRFPEKQGYKKPISIVTHRKLEPEYDPFTVLNALLKLREEGYEFRFTFASFGSLYEDLKKKIEEYGLSQNVTITGYLKEEDLIKTILSHDFYLSASLYDSTSVSLLEAMALGLYPVVSDVEANMEWIENGKNGIIFKKHDEVSLKQALEKLFALKNDEYSGVLKHNYGIVKKTGSFRENVLKVVRSLL